MFEDILNYSSEKETIFRDYVIEGEIVDADPKYVYILYHNKNDGINYIIGYNGSIGYNSSPKSKKVPSIKTGDKVNIIVERKENGQDWFQNVYKRWEYSYWKKRKEKNNPIKEWEKALRMIYIVTVEAR